MGQVLTEDREFKVNGLACLAKADQFSPTLGMIQDALEELKSERAETWTLARESGKPVLQGHNKMNFGAKGDAAEVRAHTD